MKTLKVVAHRRISTESQDLRMQESADAPYREQHPSNQLVIINEHGVSANKLSIKDRPKMQKLIKMIKNNEVKVLYTFDRSRLFRDFYEANLFLSLCKKHNVKIIFTSSGHQQASDSTLIEGVMNIVGDIEGENIARRSAEARKRFPAQKFGYEKKKETKQYIKDLVKSAIIIDFFKELAEVKSVLELDNVLTKYKKLLKKKPDDLLKLATDPFYAGYDLSNGENKLQHVEPYLSLKSFKDLQTKNVMISQYANKKTELLNENTFEPYCGKCEKPMKFKFSVLEDKAWYTCSNQSNHPKILLSTQDLTCVVNKILDKALQELDTSKIIKDSRQYFNNMRKVIHKELSAITRKKEQLRQRIILENDELTNWRDSPTYSELSKLEDMQQQLLKEINEKEELLLDNKELTILATEYLLKSKQKNLFSLAPMLVERLDIYPGKINITMSRFDYLKHLNNQYVFKGGNLY